MERAILFKDILEAAIIINKEASSTENSLRIICNEKLNSASIDDPLRALWKSRFIARSFKGILSSVNQSVSQPPRCSMRMQFFGSGKVVNVLVWQPDPGCGCFIMTDVDAKICIKNHCNALSISPDPGCGLVKPLFPVCAGCSLLDSMSI